VDAERPGLGPTSLAASCPMQMAEKNAAPILGEVDGPPQRLFYGRQQDDEKRKHMVKPDGGVAGVVWKALRDGWRPAASSCSSSDRQRLHDAKRTGAKGNLSFLMRYQARLAKAPSMRLQPREKCAIRHAFDDVASYTIGTKGSLFRLLEMLRAPFSRVAYSEMQNMLLWLWMKPGFRRTPT